MKKYDNLLGRRSGPPRTLLTRELFEDLQENEDVRYLLGAMEPLDAHYTQKALAEAESVHKHFNAFSTVRLQGSVKTNTHIRYYSDIDILTLAQGFKFWEPQRPANMPAYLGDPIVDLKAQRQRARSTVELHFPNVQIAPKDRALRLSGGGLKRNLDVVAANWHNNLTYQHTRLERDRGIQVLDVSNDTRVLNKPFLHEHLINSKNQATVDGLGRAVRLLKTLKVDADTSIPISSYDICALIWNMPDHQLPGHVGASFQLASQCHSFLLELVTNEPALNALSVPNSTRKIIDQKEGTSLVAVRSLWHELHLLLENIKKAGKSVERRYTVANRSLQPVY